MKFRKEMYAKIALIKSAYNFSDVAYIHLDADDDYYYVTIEPKDDGCIINEKDFLNEMLTQSVRHEVYKQTKSIRELLLARAMATSVIADEKMIDDTAQDDTLCEDEILRDWFDSNEENKN
jgi:His-Xaa-Ser system protein HxsD